MGNEMATPIKEELTKDVMTCRLYPCESPLFAILVYNDTARRDRWMKDGWKKELEPFLYFRFADLRKTFFVEVHIMLYHAAVWPTQQAFLCAVLLWPAILYALDPSKTTME
jgi:hypothetical protein